MAATPDTFTRRWSELSPLLDRLLELEPAQRPAWLEHHCQDAELRAALEVLLTDADRELKMLDAGAADCARALLSGDANDQASAGWAGRRLGAWRVLDLVGEGGMASVFRAERDDGGYAQQVAIKLLRLGIFDPYEQRRFLRERQILARLEHPNIARLIDGGLTPEGVPWFALEFVEGEPLDQYCDQRQLDVEARLHLFLTVCEAVQHAHRALVVHRDLKPSNILVRADGSVKLLDFGIAHLIEDEPGTGTAEPTATAQQRLTPAYAAPEQWRGEAVTTATDVYALGVLLHVLVTGLKPSRRDDGTMRPPSSYLAAATDRDDISGRRASSCAQLIRRLRGDLDTIVGTALQVEAARRYQSVQTLIEDVQRHLQGRPLRARRDTFWYRSGKFVRRHRWGVAASALIVALLAGSTVFYSQQASRAQVQADRAETVRQFLVQLFRSREPGSARAALPTTEELLASGESAALRMREHSPVLAVDLLSLFAAIQRRSGNLPRAGELLEQATAALAPGLPDDVRFAHRQEQALLERDRGNLEQAERLLLELELGPRAGVAQQRTLWREQAVVMSRLGRHDEAIELHRRALAEMEREPLPLPADQALALADFGTALLRAGRPEQAEPVLAEALAAQRETLGDVHEEIALTSSNLAVALRSLRRYEPAEQLLRQSIEISRQVYDGPHPGLAQRLNNLGTLLNYLGRQREAVIELESALAMNQELLPDDHPELARTRSNLALALLSEGEQARSVELFTLALDAMRSKLGARHLNVAVVLNNLASAELRGGNLAAARRHAEAGLAIKLESVAPDSETVAHSRLLLARILIEEQRPQAAYEEAMRAAAIYRTLPGERSERIIDAHLVLARARRLDGALEAAGIELAEAERLLEQLSAASSAQRVDYWLERAWQAHARGDRAQMLDARDRAEQAAQTAGTAAQRDVERFDPESPPR